MRGGGGGVEGCEWQRGHKIKKEGWRPELHNRLVWWTNLILAVRVRSLTVAVESLKVVVVFVLHILCLLLLHQKQ